MIVTWIRNSIVSALLSTMLIGVPAVSAQTTCDATDIDKDNDGLIEVCTLEDLDAIRHVLDGTGYKSTSGAVINHRGCPPDTNNDPRCRGYELVRDLDFNDDSSYRDIANKGRWTSGRGWLPIGEKGNGFRGILNGNGYTLSNLFIDRSTDDRVGLFGELQTSGTIIGIGLLGVSARGDTRVGGLAGRVFGTVTITRSYSIGRVSGTVNVGGLIGDGDGSTIADSHSSATVSGATQVGGLVGTHWLGSVITGSYSRGRVSGTGNRVGGLVGWNRGMISNSYSNGSVSGNDSVGGLVGITRNGSILSSYSRAIVSGNDFVGGLAGRHSFGVVHNSYSHGSVSGRGLVGGLIGTSGGRISNSYSSGSVSSNDSFVGGLVGYNSGTIGNSYSSSSVNSKDFVGGLVGYNARAAINNSYSIGSASGRNYVGGLVGFELQGTVTVTNSYWDTEMSQLSHSSGGTSKTTAMLQDPIAAIGIYREWSGTDWDFGTAKHYPAIKYTPGPDASNPACGPPPSLKPACGSLLPGQKRIQVVISTATLIHINVAEDDLIVLEAAPGQSISDAIQIEGSPLSIGTINSSKRWVLAPPDLVAREAVQTTLRFQVAVSDGTDTQQTTVLVVATKINNGNVVLGSIVQNGNDLTAPMVGSLSDVDGGVDISSIRYRWQRCFVGEDCLGEAGWGDTHGTSQSYSLVGVEAKRNNRFRVVVSYRDGQGYSNEAISRPIVYFARSDTLAPVFTMDWSRFPRGAQAVCDDDDIDNDNDGLIEICHLEDLDAVRYELDGSGYRFYGNIEKRTKGCGLGGCNGYELVRDLDFNDDDSYLSTANRVRWTTATGWLPIGSEADRFKGIFDGNGYTLSNLMIDRPSLRFVGLFGYLQGGAISEIDLLDVMVHGRDWTGGLVGHNNSGTISNSYSSGAVSNSFGTVPSGTVIDGFGGLGGLVGHNERGIISNSYSSATVHSGYDSVGGLVGWNTEGAITNSYNSGRVTGRFNVGGLVGRNERGIISNSYSSRSVNGGGPVGGLVGWNNGTITNSYSSATVNATGRWAGGLVGWNNGGTISNSYSTGQVAADTHAGGLIGENTWGTISNSYSSATVNATGRWAGGLVGYNNRGTVSSSYSIGSVSGRHFVGGLVGLVAGNSMISNSYWDLTTSGLQNSAGGIGKTTTELQSPTSAIGIYSTWSSVVWDFGATVQYPVIKYTQGTDADNPACGTLQQPPCGSLLPEQRTRQIAISTQAIVRANAAEGETVILNAAIGNWTYQWVQTDGTSLTFSTVDTASLRFVVPPDLVVKEATTEVLTFQLTVSTGTAMSTEHIVRIVAVKVNNGLMKQPTITREKNQLIAQLDLGSDVDGAGTIQAYRWQRCLSSPATDVCNIWGGISTSAVYLIPTTAAKEGDRFRVQLTYIDGQGYSASRTSEVFRYREAILFRLKLFLEGALQ